jgi:hypothetical protein
MSLDKLVNLGLDKPLYVPELAGFTLRQTIIEHSIFQEAIREVARLHSRWRDAGVFEGMLLVAQTGSGKSTTLKYYRDQFPRYETPTGTKIPVLYVATPESPTVRDLAQKVLDALGDPAADKGSASAKTRRIIHLVKQCGVEMVFIDEFHHFADGKYATEATRVSNWVKLLIEEIKRPVVLAGLPRAIAVVNRNPELRRRFCAPHELRPFGFATDDERREFRAVLKKVHSLVPASCKCPPLHALELAERFHFASLGLFDYVVKIVETAVSKTAANHDGNVTLAALAEAFAVAVWKHVPDDLNPFNEGARLRRLTKAGEPFDILDDMSKYTGLPRRRARPQGDGASLGQAAA